MDYEIIERNHWVITEELSCHQILGLMIIMESLGGIINNHNLQAIDIAEGRGYLGWSRSYHRFYIQGSPIKEDIIITYEEAVNYLKRKLFIKHGNRLDIQG